MEPEKFTNQRGSNLVYTILICFCFQSMIVAELKVSCQPGWNVSIHSGTCVMLRPDQKSWASARDDCKKYKADFVKIIGSAMNNFITDLLEAETIPAFIGLQPSDRLRIYDWIADGSEADYLNWAKSNDGSSKRCVKIEIHGDARGKWNRVDCNEKLNYVCERPPGPQSNLAPAFCPPGWIISATSGTCIKTYYTRNTWKEARVKCKSENGDLVVILDETMKTLVSDQVYTDETGKYWIGLSDHKKKDEFRWLNNGPKVDSSKWFDDKSTGSCALINYPGRAGKWTFQDCGGEYSYICEISTRPTSRRGKTLKQCPSGYILRPSVNKCYTIEDKLSNWESARGSCHVDKGDLVTIADAATSQFILDELSLVKEKPYWIGLNDHKQKNSFRWLDEEEEATYTNWFNGQQSEAGIQRCGAVGNGWSAQGCSLRFPFICETFSDCENAKYGTICPRNCGSSCAPEACDKRTGLCIPAGAGNQECEAGKYGRNCKENCNMNCAGPDNKCDITSGECISGCDSGYKGDMCDKACNNHTYGVNCSQSCSPNCKGGVCDTINGECLGGCEKGYHGDNCKHEIPKPNDNRRKENKKSPLVSNLALTVGAVVTLILIA